MALNPCLTYFVHLAADGTPIPGTMFGAAKAHGQATCDRKIAIVPTYQVPVTRECRPQSGLRYFYKINKRTGQILPNSMFSMSHKPKSMCSGIESVLEFIVTQHS